MMIGDQCYEIIMLHDTHNVVNNLQVAIASGDERYMEKVREAQLGIDLPNVICVDAKGLSLKEDNLHLTTEAQVKLGHMLADAFLTHFNAPPSQSSPCSAPKTG